MSKRNETRLPSPEIKEPEVASQNVANLDFITPTEFIDLPSEGKLYPEGHPLCGVDQIEIKFMSAKEEDILASKSNLKKGVAVDRCLQSVIVDKNIKLDDLLTGDKNALTVATRITGYGSDYRIEMPCPNPTCNKSVPFTFDLNEVKVVKGSLEGLDAELTDNNTAIITLPKTKWTVEVKFMTGEDEKWLVEYTEKKRKNKLPETPMTDQFKRVILSINGVIDPLQISNAVDNMPAFDSKYLRLAYKLISPNVDLKQIFICKECDFEQEVEMPFTAEFFWPDR